MEKLVEHNLEVKKLFRVAQGQRGERQVDTLNAERKLSEWGNPLSSDGSTNPTSLFVSLS